MKLKITIYPHVDITAIWRKVKTWYWVLRTAKNRRRRKHRTAAEVAKKFHLTPEEREDAEPKLREMDPGRHEPGYDARSGAIIYPDSVSMVMYVGSEQEAIDAAKPKMPRQQPKPTPTGKKTCTDCFGWGFAYIGWSDQRKACFLCGGKGWT